MPHYNPLCHREGLVHLTASVSTHGHSIHLRHSSKVLGLKKAGSVDAGGNPVKIAQAIHTGGSQPVPDHPSTDGAGVSVAGLLSGRGEAGQLCVYPF